MEKIGSSTTGGVTESMYYDGYTGDFVKKTSQNIAPILDNNQDDRSMVTTKRDANGYKVASIPMAVITEWKKQGFDIFHCDEKEILKKLSDPAYKNLLTSHLQSF